MSPSPRPNRVLIVGAGFAGLASAARLAQSGVPVTVLESSAELGRAASSQNQGWLHSGAAFAANSVPLAAACLDSLRRTVHFCPECVEDSPVDGRATNRMVYFTVSPKTDLTSTTEAWQRAGLIARHLTAADVRRELPDVRAGLVHDAYSLPDRPFRPAVLLRKLADEAVTHGAELRLNTPVLGLIVEDDVVLGVELPGGETLRGGLVLLATGAFNHDPVVTRLAGRELDLPGTYSVSLQRSHLVSCTARLTSAPFRLIDDGFTSVPHGDVTVFGAEARREVGSAAAAHTEPAELKRLWETIEEVVPAVRRDSAPGVREWAGVTAYVSRLGGGDGGPEVIDHSHATPPAHRLLSVFPGRATLWFRTAEVVRQAVMERIDPPAYEAAEPRWGRPEPLARRAKSDAETAAETDEAEGFEFVAPAP